MKKDTLLVIRGHKTKDITGVKEVICSNTQDDIISLAKKYDQIDKLIESDRITFSFAKKHCANKQYKRIVYLGGTALMNWRLKNNVYCTVDMDTQKIEYTVKKPTKTVVKPTPLKADFMVYEKNMRNGISIVALFGASPVGTSVAVNMHIKSKPFDGYERIRIGEVLKADMSDLKILYGHDAIYNSYGKLLYFREEQHNAI